MKKILLILFIMMYSTTSFSRWVEVAENDEGTLMFIDLDSIRKDGNFTFIITMQDFTNSNPLPMGMNVLSSIIHIKADCKTFRYKFLNFATYKYSMAESLIESKPSKNQDWRFIIPDSVMEKTHKLACYAGKVKKGTNN